MRTLIVLFLTCWFALSSVLSSHATTPPQKTPSIASVRGKTVTVRVPAGFKAVTLRQRTGLRKTPWKMLGTKITDPAGGIIKFTLRSAVAPRALALLSERAIPTTTSDARGLQLFGADPTLAVGLQFPGSSRDVVMTSGSATNSVVGANTATPVRGVVESDIWRINGDRLYFFNQLRGLQVFDIANPDSPALIGQFREPNRGEQLYQLDASHVAMLTRPSYYFSIYATPVSLLSPALDQGSGAIVIADVSAPQPREIARLPYPGYLVESRLVGTALYVVSESYSSSNSGLTVSSFDLSDPAQPKAVATLALGSYGGVISATDRFLFVVRYTSDWRRSTIEIIDISDANGALTRRGTVTTAGIVNDKFKLHLEGSRLTTISAVQRVWSGDRNDPANATRTAVENFDLTNPAAPTLLGRADVGVGESVHATRFADGRLYVVTFFTIDPLYVIDYSTPRPTILGELEVPGFSTYIAPLGDRLVAIGRVGSQTAVSLFDVSDPAQPKSLAQLPIGDGSSYSEANWDEKAFGFFPEENLIVVPYSGYDRASGWATRVQLIDLQRDSLKARGVVNHSLAARRSAIVENRLLAISSSNLITVDFTNRDLPRVTSDVEIAWRVDRVFLSGNHLVQVGGSIGWSTSEPPSITISPASAPDTILSELPIANAPVIGATVRADRLYLAQQNAQSWGYFVPATVQGGPTPAPRNPLIVSVFDLSRLPAITLLGKTGTDVSTGWGNLEALWPLPGTLVWSRQPSPWWGPIYRGPGIAIGNAVPAVSTLPAVSTSLSVGRFWPGWGWPTASSEFFIFDVRDSAAPRYLTGLTVRSGQYGDASATITAGGKLYLSTMAYDDLKILAEGQPSRRYRHFLKTVDFTDPAAPVVSGEVNIPGRLLAVANTGSTLLTVGCGYEKDGKANTNRTFHSSRFDGAEASLVDQLELPSTTAPFAIDAGNLLIGNAIPAEIQCWQIGAEEKFALAGKIASPTFQRLATVRGLLIGLGAGLPRLFDVSDPAQPRDLSTANTRELTGYDFSLTAGGAGVGLWQPLGQNGIGIVKLPAAR